MLVRAGCQLSLLPVSGSERALCLSSLHGGGRGKGRALLAEGHHVWGGGGEVVLGLQVGGCGFPPAEF